MDVHIPPEMLLDAFRRDWPQQYEISALRLLVQAQGDQIRQLAGDPPDPNVGGGERDA